MSLRGRAISFSGIGLTAMALACAKRGLPEGGPVDTTPPKIVFTEPADRAVRVDSLATIRITFSERMESRSVQSNLSITPELKTPPRLHWKGKILEIKPSLFWEGERTYTFTFGGQAQDGHGIRMGETFTFSFSTNTVIDSGRIEGLVFAGLVPEVGASVCAYRLNSTADIDPMRQKPEYVTVSGSSGKFRLSALADGRYRLFAVKDQNRDRLWQPKREPFAVGTGEITLDSNSRHQNGLQFFLAEQDTAAFGLVRCQNLGPFVVWLEFNQPLDFGAWNWQENFELRERSDSAGRRSDVTKITRAAGMYEFDAEPKNLYLVTERLSIGSTYDLILKSFTDRYGKPLDSARAHCRFTVAAEPAPPLRIVQTIPRSGEKYFDPGQLPLLVVNYPLKSPVDDAAVLLQDTTGIVVGHFRSGAMPVHLLFSPTNGRALSPGEVYRLRVDEKKIVDILGRRLGDSTRVIEFRTVAEESLGTVTGKVKASPRDGDVQVHLLFTGLTRLEVKRELTMRATAAGNPYSVALLSGKYRLSGYVDANGNGRYDAGRVTPFLPAEPQTVLADTVNVRARFETEEVDLMFP